MNKKSITTNTKHSNNQDQNKDIHQLRSIDITDLCKYVQDNDILSVYKTCFFKTEDCKNFICSFLLGYKGISMWHDGIFPGAETCKRKRCMQVQLIYKK